MTLSDRVSPCLLFSLHFNRGPTNTFSWTWSVKLFNLAVRWGQRCSIRRSQRSHLCIKRNEYCWKTAWGEYAFKYIIMHIKIILPSFTSFPVINSTVLEMRILPLKFLLLFNVLSCVCTFMRWYKKIWSSSFGISLPTEVLCMYWLFSEWIDPCRSLLTWSCFPKLFSSSLLTHPQHRLVLRAWNPNQNILKDNLWFLIWTKCLGMVIGNFTCI